MDKNQFLNEYFNEYNNLIYDRSIFTDLIKSAELLQDTQKSKNKIILAGNGASAAIASHCALDFTKQAGVRAVNFNEPSMVTAFSNDYGYEDSVVQAIKFYADPGDTIILISSSGKSPNMVRAAEHAKNKNYNLITFTGFSPENPVKQLGGINFWVDSKAYNIIECIHMIWLTSIVDSLIGKAEYPVS
ncbi:SIS domain-containing protein [candidate division KSB1 bacterium]|nr:SIS domain-containing protein [candidate division KSB1 bacterium]